MHSGPQLKLNGIFYSGYGWIQDGSCHWTRYAFLFAAKVPFLACFSFNSLVTPLDCSFTRLLKSRCHVPTSASNCVYSHSCIWSRIESIGGFSDRKTALAMTLLKKQLTMPIWPGFITVFICWAAIISSFLIGEVSSLLFN